MENPNSNKENLNNDVEVMDDPENEENTGIDEESLAEAEAVEAGVPVKIEELSKEIEEFQSVEEIKDEINRLKEELNHKSAMYKEILMNFSGRGINISKYEEEFPGITDIYKLSLKCKLNTWQTIRSKDIKTDEGNMNLIKSYLKTGEYPTTSNPAENERVKMLIDNFLEEKGLADAKVKSMADAIWSEKPKSYYEGAIAHLKNQAAALEKKNNVDPSLN